MKVISWNVNSIRARIDLIIKILKEEDPDFLCLQETKIINDQFPSEKFKDLNYFSYFNGMASYNGVAILSKKKAKNSFSISFCKKNDARHLSMEIKGMEIISVYVPAGGDVPDPKENPKFDHKLNFLNELDHYLKKKKKDKVVLCGDLNIAPEEDDVWSHKSLINVVSHTEVERKKLKRILSNSHFNDSIRKHLNPPDNVFTWWSYRSPNFQKNNRGRRLDHIWVSEFLNNKVISAKILKVYRTFDRPSDHVPVCLTLQD